MTEVAMYPLDLVFQHSSGGRKEEKLKDLYHHWCDITTRKNPDVMPCLLRNHKNLYCKTIEFS